MSFRPTNGSNGKAQPKTNGKVNGRVTGTSSPTSTRTRRSSRDRRSDDIAVIGLSCRFPGAQDADAFWQNLVTGTETVSRFTAEDLAADGVDPGLLTRPDFVPAGGVLGDVDLFDAGFFGYTPREAEILDPQQRLFLEHAWWAMEDAGYDVERITSPVGVFAGCAMSSYLSVLYQNPKLLESVGWFQVLISNDKDYLATRASYKLDLRGPSVVVQTACSTGLVAIQYAARSLLSGECTMALAGASTVRLPERAGHFHSPGGIYSPHGQCRPFDSTADGTVFGNGVGVVVLKKLADAQRDGDPVRAVLKGGAVNNDGRNKVGYTAPSLAGQTAVIEAAHRAAGVSADSIGYIEAHGTGTYLGDPIEVEALTAAFRLGSRRTGYCALGAVKAGIGHLDPTAGVAGFIKTVLALEHAILPPAVNYTEPNADIDFDSTPFFVNRTAQPWTARPRRAGVSAFGIGGTNAHVVLEQAPDPVPAPPARRPQVLPLSGRSQAVVTNAAERLAAQLEAHPELDLGDVAHTLQVGRRQFGTRLTVVASSTAEAIANLRAGGAVATAADRPTVFLFPGQGSQHVGMAREVLAAEPVYAAAFSECVRLVAASGGPDLAQVLAATGPDAEARLAQTSITQPALFAVEYALGTLWQSWGVQPAALLGHSVGEYVAATLAGVMRLEDAVAIVTERGRLMQEQPPGAMLAVPLHEGELAPRLGADVTVAAINEPDSCIVAGAHPAIDDLAARLGAEGISTQQLRTSHAFHSPMMDGVLAPLREVVAGVALHEPSLPFVSCVSGTWITAAEATDPDYWVRQLRQMVRFADGVRTVLGSAPDGCVLLEVGPGQALTGLARRNPAKRPADRIVPSLPHAHSDRSGHLTLLDNLGRLWSEGAPVRWPEPAGPRRRVSLPGYPFERRRFWAVRRVEARRRAEPGTELPRPLPEWFEFPLWDEAPLAPGVAASGRWVVSGGAGRLADAVVRRLAADRAEVQDLTGSAPANQVSAQTRFSPDVRRIVHLTGPFDLDGSDRVDWPTRFNREQQRGYFSVVRLAQALVRSRVHGQVDVLVASSGTQRVQNGDVVRPERRLLEAACLTVSQEYPNLRFRVIDLDPAADVDSCADQLVTESVAGTGFLVAVRAGHRLVRRYRPTKLSAADPSAIAVRDGDVVLVTGGLGGVGLALAQALARQAKIHLLLLGRSGLAGDGDRPPDGTPAGRRLRALRAIERTGSTWEVVRADLAQFRPASRLAADLLRRYRHIDLVVHAAGSVAPDAFFGVEEVTLPRAAQVWDAKINGLVALHSGLADRPPRSWVLVSSLSTVLGGLGFSAYAAGNAFLDAYAEQHDGEDGARWLSVDWDAWRIDADLADGSGSESGTAITAETGGEALCRLLAGPMPPRVVVSTTDLAGRLARWVGERSVEPAPAPAAHVATAAAGSARDIEVTVAALWEELMGVENPQPEDDFFTDLGGHSLLATQVASRLRAQFDVEITLRQFLETPTLRGLSATIWHALEQRNGYRPAPAEQPPAGIPKLDRKAHRRSATAGAPTPDREPEEVRP